jgi:hypothetical protein
VKKVIPICGVRRTLCILVLYPRMRIEGEDKDANCGKKINVLNVELESILDGVLEYLA